LDVLIQSCKGLFNDEPVSSSKIERIQNNLLALLDSEFLRLTSEINSFKTTLAAIAVNGKEMNQVIDDLGDLLWATRQDGGLESYLKKAQGNGSLKEGRTS
jgi:hypothetical protein